MKEARSQEDQEPDVCWGDNEIKKGEDDNGPPAAKHSESQKRQKDAPCINQPELHLWQRTKMFSRKFRNRMQHYRRHWRRWRKEMTKTFLKMDSYGVRLGDESLKLCMPQQYQSLVISLAHCPGHLGRDKTLARILDVYYWPGVSSDVQQLCTACLECQKGSQARPRKATLQSLPVISEPFSKIGMDLVGPLPRTKLNNRHILVVMDYATRWPEAFPLSTMENRAIADELLVLFTRVGVPNIIVTDYGANFLSRLMRELYCLLGMKSIHTNLYHPETDRMIERFNQTLKTMIRKSSKLWNQQWDLALPYILGEYRRSPHSTTGFTPSELLYGRQMRGSLQALKGAWTTDHTAPQDVISYVTSVQERFEKLRSLVRQTESGKKDDYKQNFDKKTKKRKFGVGDLVLLKTPPIGPKLWNEWEGPYYNQSDQRHYLQVGNT